MAYISFSMIFSSAGYTPNNKPETKTMAVPTYITICPRKDGTTAKTKRLNPRRTTSKSTLLPLKRKLKASSSNFSSILPKFHVGGSSYHRRPSSIYSDNSFNSNLQPVTRSTLVTLPNEIISNILYYLDYITIQKLSRTCSIMYPICHDDRLWRRFLYADFHSVPPLIQENALTLERKKGITRLASSFNLKLYRNHLKLDQRWLTGKVNTRFLQGHQDSIYCLAWISKDLLISGSRDKTLKIWHIPTSKCIRTIEDEHDGSILCMRVDKENQLLMTGSSDATCTIWSLPQVKPILKLRGHGHNVLDVCLVNNNRIVTSSRDHTLRVWDKNTGAELRQMLGHTASVNAIEPVGGNRVVSASGDSTLKLWDVETGECIRTMKGHKLGLACIKYCDGRLYSGGLEGRIKVWDVETGECLDTLLGHAGMIRSIDCLNGKIVSGSYDRSLRVWDIKTGACVLSFQSGHSNWIFNVLMSGTRIVSSGQEKRIMILDFSNGLSPLCN
ncbi:WD40-repeat-containing domain protein [Helicostylum pulchrum]|uniref:F-box domain-containing protein n=1 Tax=Helicostylum pulchrum TaxID=562976 RepID=A0ABP9Y8M8_9FUNG|nr:WD40-repeat-containing domain protein [Helicostylum pulchrum]